MNPYKKLPSNRWYNDYLTSWLVRFRLPAGVELADFVPGRGVLPRVAGGPWPPPTTPAEAACAARVAAEDAERAARAHALATGLA